MKQKSFATTINCMDGRTQEPIIAWVKKEFDVDFVDSITEAGPDGIFAEEKSELIQSIKNRVMISVQKHGSKNIVIVAHHDCAGNPVSKEEHIRHVKAAADQIRRWSLNVNIVGVWMGEDRNVKKIL